MVWRAIKWFFSALYTLTWVSGLIIGFLFILALLGVYDIGRVLVWWLNWWAKGDIGEL